MITNPKDQITSSQAAVAVASILVGAGILTLPRSAAEQMNTPDGWIAVILGGLVTMGIAAVLVKLSQRFPGKTFYLYSQEIVGKFLGYLLSLVLVVYFTLLAGFEIRTMGEVTKSYLLLATPKEVTMIMMLWVGVYLVVGGINPMMRLFEILLPPTVLIFFVVLLLSLQIFELDNLRPVLGQVTPLFKGVQTTSLAYAGVEAMLILTAFMREPDKAVKAVLVGIAFPIAFYVMTMVMVIGGLSVDLAKLTTWPTISLIQSFEVTGIVFERFETFLLAVWILQIFTTFASAYYFAALGLSQLFKKNIHPFIYALLPLIYLVAMTPKNVNDLFKLGDLLGYIFVFVAGIMPPILLAIAVLRGKKHGPKA
ncbi:GerAB/ArcD/ProY family transporter [Lihuaxuella thermophila]|uniref:Spore germination protein n=1 Tax=Lihuaxuella thermophila TaxID=1173111 RepID=A0A1H8BGX7_9BACL|nr:spore germination protein [Lihuaxuella thermophila]SEM81709.1 spore germination protein [Lihuaxuella thermophila]